MSKRKVIMPTEAEDATITAAIKADPEDFEADAEWFAKAKRHRGKQKAPTKVAVSIRLDEDIVSAYKAGGKGWQSRANDALRAAMPHGKDAKRDPGTGRVTTGKRKVRVRPEPKKTA